MDSEKFSEIANQSRWLIIKYWLLFPGMTNSEAAEILVNRAVNRKLIEPRILTGNFLKKWMNNKQAPLWACLSAFELSIENRWFPEIEEEWVVFGYLFIKLYQSVDLLELLHYLPNYIEKDLAIQWIELAIRNQIEYEANKNS